MIRLIAACDQHRGIARSGQIPWNLATDRKYFAAMTKKFGAKVLMGRKTFETIGHPLSDRENYVVGHHLSSQPDVAIVSDVQEFVNNHADIWVIGGRRLYEETIGIADELYLTEIDGDYNCDNFFPDYAKSFDLCSVSQEIRESGVSYKFCVYKRKIRL